MNGGQESYNGLVCWAWNRLSLDGLASSNNLRYNRNIVIDHAIVHLGPRQNSCLGNPAVIHSRSVPVKVVPVEVHEHRPNSHFIEHTPELFVALLSILLLKFPL
jgi:hypothetical protein